MEELRNKLDRCFDRLQNLQIKPTQHNMETLLQTLYDLKDVYNALKEGEENGRKATDA